METSIIFLTLFFLLSCVVSYFIIHILITKNDIRESEVKGLLDLKSKKIRFETTSIPCPKNNIFENIVLETKDLSIFHDFLNKEADFFIHDKLKIQKNAAKVNAFLSDCNNTDLMSKLTAGFIFTVTSKISNDLIDVFYKFYNEENENVLNEYLAYWFINKIRILELSFSAITSLDGNYSQSNVLEKDNLLFLESENKVHSHLGLNPVNSEKQQTIQQNKQVIQ